MICWIISLIGFFVLSGCTGEGTLVDDGPTTGVSELNTAHDFDSNSTINNFRNKVNNYFGYSFYFYDEPDAPNIEGSYGIDGMANPYYNGSFYGWYQLSSGTFRFYNQTTDGYIRSDYVQKSGQSGYGEGKIIICGYSNSFTIYSVMMVEQAGYKAKAAFVIEGYKQGNELVCKYLMVPIKHYGTQVFYPTIGQVTYTKNSSSYKNEEINDNCTSIDDIGMGMAGHIINLITEQE